MTVHEPAAVLEFSDDLRPDDAAPLRAFLHARLTEAADRQQPGTEAEWAARRLLQTTDYSALFLCDLLTSWADIVEAGRIGRPGATQQLRQDVRTWWNHLCQTAERFSDHPDHLPRWRPLRHLCVAHAELAEQLTDGFSSGVYEGGAHP
ncbi:hypothetical protein ACFY7C_01070 [Streptomyces sp. NPDC012769]|uniref:hypothetical protein n=1 Tax=Streptomyces sp. NPDC012769 TaxID=3364848 RepID=UPI0036C9E87C